MDDLHPDSLQHVQSLAAARCPQKHYDLDPPEEFLIRIGAASRQYKYRISDDDCPDEEINLFTFFEKVSARFFATSRESFSRRDECIQNPDGDLSAASLQDALVNALIHSDYLLPYASVRIEACEDRIVFKNPGQMRIDPETFFPGGTSKPRNEILMKLFCCAGLARQQGFGGKRIVESAECRQTRPLGLSASPEKAELVIWTRSDSARTGRRIKNEQTVRSILAADPKREFSFSELLAQSGQSEYRLRKYLNALKQKGTVTIREKGRSLRYVLHAPGPGKTKQQTRPADKTQLSS